VLPLGCTCWSVGPEERREGVRELAKAGWLPYCEEKDGELGDIDSGEGLWEADVLYSEYGKYEPVEPEIDDCDGERV
jgi:hypothetical protein